MSCIHVNLRHKHASNNSNNNNSHKSCIFLHATKPDSNDINRVSIAQSCELFVSTSDWGCNSKTTGCYSIMTEIVTILLLQMSELTQHKATGSADKQLHERRREDSGRHNSRFLRVCRQQSGANCGVSIRRCAHITITSPHCVYLYAFPQRNVLVVTLLHCEHISWNICCCSCICNEVKRPPRDEIMIKVTICKTFLPFK